MLDVQLLELNRDLYPLDMPGPGTKKSKSKRGKTNGASRDLSNVDIPTVLDTVLNEIDQGGVYSADLFIPGVIVPTVLGGCYSACVCTHSQPP